MNSSLEELSFWTVIQFSTVTYPSEAFDLKEKKIYLLLAPQRAELRLQTSYSWNQMPVVRIPEDWSNP